MEEGLACKITVTIYVNTLLLIAIRAGRIKYQSDLHFILPWKIHADVYKTRSW